MGELVVLSDYKKSKAPAPKELSYGEWLRFCCDPFDFLKMISDYRKRTEGDER